MWRRCLILGQALDAHVYTFPGVLVYHDPTCWQTLVCLHCPKISPKYRNPGSGHEVVYIGELLCMFPLVEQLTSPADREAWHVHLWDD